MAVLGQLYTEAPKLRRFFNNISKSFTRKMAKSLLSLPRPQALIKKVHASHYMKGLHEVVHRVEQAQGVMGLRHRKVTRTLIPHSPLRAYYVTHYFM
jgi:hypothetical protein